MINCNSLYSQVYNVTAQKLTLVNILIIKNIKHKVSKLFFFVKNKQNKQFKHKSSIQKKQFFDKKVTRL